MDFKKVVTLFILFGSVFGIVANAAAIDMPHIDRSKIRLYIKPDSTQVGEVVVENNSDAVMYMRVYPQDWYYSSGDGSKEFVPVNATLYSCASWISFSPAEFRLPAFSQQKVRYSLKVPSDASGGYYSVLFFENMVGKVESQPHRQTVGVNLAVRFATLFYIEVEGTVERRGLLENIELKKASFYAPLLINADFVNTGNVDIVASGVFVIADKSGKVFGRGQIDDLYTLSGDKIKLKGIWRENLEPGSYNFILTLDMGKAGHKSDLEKGPFLIKELELNIASDGTLSSFNETK